MREEIPALPLLTYFRVVGVDTATLSTAGGTLQQVAASLSQGKRISVGNDLQAVERLIFFLQSRLGVYPHSIDDEARELTELEASGQHFVKRANVLRLLISEKTILTEIMSWCVIFLRLMTVDTVLSVFSKKKIQKKWKSFPSYRVIGELLMISLETGTTVTSSAFSLGYDVGAWRTLYTRPRSGQTSFK